MPTQTPRSPDDDSNPADKHYGDTFNRLTSAEHKSGANGSDGTMGGGFDNNDTFNKLGAAERQATSDVTGQDTPGDTLGQGYTGSPKGEQKLNPSKKRTAKTVVKGLAKRKSSYFVAAILAGLIGTIIGIMSMSSLKLIATMDSINNVFSSSENEALDKMSQRMLNRYIVKDVITALGHGECRSTISPKCVVTPKESGPIGKLYRAWANKKLEYKLATDYGIIFGSERNGTHYYMSVDGNRTDLHDVISGKKTIFEVGAGDSSPAEIRRTIKAAFKDASLWDKTWTRYKVGRYLSRTVGLPRCFWAGCLRDDNARDKFFAKKADWTLAAKAGLVNRVIIPVTPQYGLIVMCILDSSQDQCKTKDLEKAQAGDNDRQTKSNKKIKTSIASTAAKLAGQGIDPNKLIKTANEISEKGPREFVVNKILEKVGLEAGTKTVVKSVSVIGWIIMAAELIHGLDQAGPIISHIAYAVNSTGSMALYQTYNTVAAQQKQGTINPQVIGSFSDSLATNMDPNAPKSEQFDMTATPIYKNVIGGGDSTNVASSLLGGTAYAASNDTADNDQAAKYGSKNGHCDGGGLPEKSIQICSEEALAYGSATANSIHNAITSIPGLSGLSSLITAALKIVASPFSWLMGQIIKPFVYACHKVNFCDAALAKAKTAIGDLMNVITGKVIHDPFSAAMNGARIGTMLFAGADASHNAACKEMLGCQRVSHQVATNIQQRQLAEAKQEFHSQPLFARLFSTDSPYSLVSRIAIAMPGGLSATSHTIANTFLRSPLASFGNLFGSVFQTQPAFAAGFNASQSFGIDDYAYTSMPDDPVKFWNNNCVDGPDGKWNPKAEAGHQLDISDWLNNDANVGFNDKTGESYFKHSNPCMLIVSSVQATGAMFDPSLIPADDNIIYGSGGGDSDSGTPTSGSAQDVAKEILKNDNVSYQYDAKDDVELAAKGKNGTCGKPLDASLLKIVLDIARQHKVTVSAFESHCSGHMDGSAHYKGKAVDIVSIDGTVGYKKIASVWPLIKGDVQGGHFLQHQCPGTGSVPNGMQWYSGDICTHIHYQIGY